MKTWHYGAMLICIFLVFNVALGIASADRWVDQTVVFVANKLKIWDGADTWGIDSVDGSGIMIGLEHHEIHDGNHYMLDHYDSDVDIATPFYMVLVAPDDQDVHLFLKGATSAAGLFEFFENATTTNNGTAITVYNNNRNSANSANMLVFNDSTMNSDGTRMLIGYVGSAEGKKGIGGIDARDSEVILGRGWTYAVKFTTTADDTKMTLSTHFYEVDA